MEEVSMSKDYSVCGDSEDGEHEADPYSINIADGVEWVVDVNCIHCGQSTGIWIDPSRICWD